MCTFIETGSFAIVNTCNRQCKTCNVIQKNYNVINIDNMSRFRTYGGYKAGLRINGRVE